MNRDERAVALAALLLGVSVAALPLPPATDWLQHLSLATLLRRLWDGDPVASSLFVVNPATHNAGVHLLLAALPRWISPIDAGRVLLGLCPPLLLLAATRLLRRLQLPVWRALLLVPATLGFCFGWGLINFYLGTAIAWLLLDGLLAQFERPRIARAGLLAVGSLVLGVTHVLAMLLACLVAAAVGLEHLLRSPSPRRALFRVGGAGLLLLPGCLYDLRVYFLHTSTDAGAYTSPPFWPDEPGFFKKLGLLGALISGLFTSYADTVLAWCVVGLVVILATRARAASALISPLLLLLPVYFLTPSVFFNTHLIFQRIPLWILLAALLALPPLSRRLDATGRRWALLLSGLHLALVPLHFGLHHRDARGALAVLEKTPPGVCVTGAIEEARTLGVRLHTLTHAAALAVPAGAAEDSFSFARWMGLPVVYRPDRRPPYPSPSWEHDGRLYDPEAPLAKRCPVVLLRTAWREEPTANLLLRVFGAREARVLARSDSWLLIDTRR